ncbi:hypothetical protein D3C80_1995540 [compost metagenome]
MSTMPWSLAAVMITKPSPSLGAIPVCTSANAAMNIGAWLFKRMKYGCLRLASCGSATHSYQPSAITNARP